MDWWKTISRSALCNSTNKLVDEWFKRANLVSRISGYYNGIIINDDALLEQFREHCDNEVVADFAWLTLRVSQTFSCYNASDVHPLSGFLGFSIDQGWNHISIWCKRIITLLFIFVFTFGLIGNFLTVTVIYHTSSLHTHTSYFLASLATSDFFLIIFGVPYDLIYLWKKSAPTSFPAYCEIMSIAVNHFTMVSILTIVALTAERFFAICYPFSLLCLGKQRIIQCIYLLWMLALIPSLYLGLQFKQVTADFCGYKRLLQDGTGTCDYVGNAIFPFTFTFGTTFTITFVLPVLFIVYCYVRILRALSEMSHVTTQKSLNTHTNDAAADSNQQLKLCLHTKGNEPLKSQQAHKGVIKILVISTGTFFICYLPYHAERLIVHYKRKQCDASQLCQLLYPVTGLLLYFSGMLNPVFYNVMSVKFREACIRWLKTTLFSPPYESITV